MFDGAGCCFLRFCGLDASIFGWVLYGNFVRIHYPKAPKINCLSDFGLLEIKNRFFLRAVSWAATGFFNFHGYLGPLANHQKPCFCYLKIPRCRYLKDRFCMVFAARFPKPAFWKRSSGRGSFSNDSRCHRSFSIAFFDPGLHVIHHRSLLQQQSSQTLQGRSAHLTRPASFVCFGRLPSLQRYLWVAFVEPPWGFSLCYIGSFRWF